MTLFQVGGDDAAQNIQLGMSRTPSFIKSPWTSKLNSFLFVNPFHTLLDGILLEHPPLCTDRYDTMSTDAKGDAEEAQDSRPSKVYAWKRRKKREAKDDQDDAEDDREGGEKTTRRSGMEPGRPASSPA